MTWTSSTSRGRQCAALRPWFRRAEIVATIQTMQRAHFYKSMTSYGDHRVWQDVYHVPSEAGALYVKFTADVVTEFLLLSLRGKTMSNRVCPKPGHRCNAPRGR